MNLILDFGNTRIKAAVFNGSELLGKTVYNSEQELISSLDAFKGIKNCIIGTVTLNHQQAFELLSKKYNTLLFKPNTPILAPGKKDREISLRIWRLGGTILPTRFMV